MDILFTLPSNVRLQPWEGAFLDEIRAHFQAHPESSYRLVEWALDQRPVRAARKVWRRLVPGPKT